MHIIILLKLIRFARLLIRFANEWGLLGYVGIPCWVKNEPDSGETNPDWFVHVYLFYELE